MRDDSTMAHFRLVELKRFVGFTDRDAANLKSLARPAAEIIPHVVNKFYAALQEDQGARSVLSGGEEQIQRLRLAFAQWLGGLFEGSYNEVYEAARFRIGEVHVLVGLPQHFMPLAMEIVWCELSSGFRANRIKNIEAKLESLHKLLILDLTIMLGSYMTSYSEKIRHFERRGLESQLARAEHLAEIGQLAASLAHEIKNPLAGISGAIQIIGDSLGRGSPYRSVVQDILAQISRLDATVKDLLQYARPSAPVCKELKLSALIPRVVDLLREEPALRDVDVRFDGVHGSDKLLADEGQMEQLLINLVLNAAHASACGASIDIETQRRRGHLVLAVQDYGAGMAPEVQERAMEPFFTTKAKGTGLGLAICRRIVEAHGGTMTLKSSPGKGTKVIVELPQPRP